VLNIAAGRYFRDRKFRFSSQNEVVAILSAAGIGLVSPLPTYAAIPVGLSLLETGLPVSAVIAFAIASPLMNPSIFLLTAARIGLEMALARTVSAFLFALIGGFLAMTLLKRLFADVRPMKPPEPKPHPALGREIYSNAKYMLKYFSIAILLSAAVKALVPPETVISLLAGNAKVGTLVAIGMGVPFYTCGGSAIPFIETLMDLGMSKGATLAFFLAGPATKLETLYAYKTLLGTKILMFFLSLTFIFSYLAGLVYSLF